jgi:hypothetical protein
MKTANKKTKTQLAKKAGCFGGPRGTHENGHWVKIEKPGQEKGEYTRLPTRQLRDAASGRCIRDASIDQPKPVSTEFKPFKEWQKIEKESEK